MWVNGQWLGDVFFFPAHSFGCVLSTKFGWLYTWDHRQRWWREKLSSSSQAVCNGVQIPPDGFSTQTAASDHSTSWTRLNKSQDQTHCKFQLHFQESADQLQTESAPTLSYTSTATTQRVSEAVCVYKDNTCPWAVITDCALTMETLQYISCNVSSAPKNTTKTT